MDRSTPNLPSRDFDATSRFYSRLGFGEVWRDGNWMILERGDLTLESVRYSLRDLHYADHHLGWLTGSGRRLVGQLAEAIEQVECESERFKREVERSTFGQALRKHVKELQHARQTYGPMRLSKA